MTPKARSNTRILKAPVLAGLSALYGGASGVIRGSFGKGLRKSHSLPCKVISVGNITTGGTGKTPFVQAICQELKRAGYRIGVVSRGYGGSLSKSGAIVSDGRRILLGPKEAGDEPVLHARRLPDVPVLIGRDRVAMGAKACREFGCDVLVLDDGFQYWRLRRELDLVLIDATNPFGGERFLPAGNLREPLSELRRADALVLTKASRVTVEELEQLRTRLVRECREVTPIFEADHHAIDVYALHDEQAVHPVKWLRGREIVAACAVADGEGFIASLGQLGARVVRSFLFRDHHWITPAEYASIQAAAEQNSAPVVITEKDAVKWDRVAMTAPAYVLRIEVRLKEDAQFWSLLQSSLKANV